MESIAESSEVASSSLGGTASREQISSVLLKLQGRAANYKDKYRQLVRQYNELVNDNSKVRVNFYSFLFF